MHVPLSSLRLIPGLAMAALLLTAPVCAMASGGGGSWGGSTSSSSDAPKVDPQKAYQDGAAAMKAHDYKSAIKNFSDAHDVLPRDATVNYALGLAYIGDNNPKDARRPLERSIDGENPPADAYLQLGLVYLQLDKRSKAEDLQKSLSEVIAKCDAQCGDQRRGQLQGALESLNRALAGGGTGAASKPQGWNFPDEKTGRAKYAEAVGLINHHHYTEALAKLAEAESAAGPHPDIFNYMGFANRHLRRYDAAIGYYRQALAMHPDHVGATEYLGELYLELGRTADARAQLTKLDALCPFGCAAREELARWIATAQQ